MIINQTITKKLLENIVHETFLSLGNLSSSSLLDSLKLLGFYYATNAGISINIEDLRTPDVKKKFIEVANEEVESVSKKWQEGLLSDNERFQTIIDSWNIATESLKNRIIDYYQNYDPANNLYIMAFSGARGNMSQVRQLVGMRGLMSDQEGKIIDLPIQANFREGLSSIDYIISSYGARKGIVDTALKTADSGYLTRRLIYVAQDLIIREIDCKTKKGLILLLKKQSNTKNLFGRYIISFNKSNFPYKKIILSEVAKVFNNCEKTELETFFTKKVLEDLKPFLPTVVTLRSPLTCNSKSSICQKCYGWDLSHQKLISLGEAIGIVAAQSIGEPGTQLTMRTFHTGGIFTGETLKQVLSPFSGKVIIPESLKTIPFRTNHGLNVLKLRQEATIKVLNWKGAEQEIFLAIGSYLYVCKSSFVSKGRLLAESTKQAIVPGPRRLKPIYTSLSGEIRFEKIVLHSIKKQIGTIKVIVNNGILWITSGKVFSLPKEVKYTFLKNLIVEKSFAKLKIITPKTGLIYFKGNSLFVCDNFEKLDLNLVSLKRHIKNCSLQFYPIVKNYQFVDKHTLLGFIYIFPNISCTIYGIRRKISKYISTLFLITEKDIWTVNSDQVNNLSFFPTKKTLIRTGNLIDNGLKSSRSGLFLKKEGLEMFFQHAVPIFLRRGTILNYKQADFVIENKIFATLVNYTQQTEDIVQGLPKIEELIEARKPKRASCLASRPGVILKAFSIKDFTNSNLIQVLKYKDIIKINPIECIRSKKISPAIKQALENKIDKKKILCIAHSIFSKDDVILFNNTLYRLRYLPSIYKPKLKITKSKKRKKEEYIFKNNKPDIYLPIEAEWDQNLQLSGKKTFNINDLHIPGKKNFSIWTKIKKRIITPIDAIIYKFESNHLSNLKELVFVPSDEEIITFYKNDKKDLIIQTGKNQFAFLEFLNPLSSYELPLSSKFLVKPGNFVDLGEPITQGIIDTHELLAIFFSYHAILDGTRLGVLKSLTKFQLLLVHSVQAIYQSQGVIISSKHIEIIIKQMTSKVRIKTSGDTPLLSGELVNLSLVNEIALSLIESKQFTKIGYKPPKYEPKLLSATNSSLNKDGFLSSAGFQETRRVLTKAAIEGTSDWLRGLKESIIIGRLIPAGSSFLNYKNYLDNLYLFKD
jgi:hypothetical protein